MSGTHVELSQREHEGWLEAAFPWIASTLTHAGVFLLLIFAMFAVSRVTREVQTEVIVIPGALQVEPGEALMPGVVGSEEDLRAPLVDPKASLGKDWAKQAGPTNLASMLGEDRSELGAIGMGTKGVVGGPGIGTDSTGVMTGPVGNQSGRFIGIGGGPRGKHEVYGNATRIVYILDKSGSMTEVFDYLRKSSQKSVDSLIPTQSFGLVVFSEHAEVAMNMTRATLEGRREFAGRMATVTTGGENDYQLIPFREAFEKAFAMKPQVIYFLTDGAFDKGLIGELRGMNRDKRVRICTLACVSSSETGEMLELYKLLDTVAKENGGSFRKVFEKDLAGE